MLTHSLAAPSDGVNSWNKNWNFRSDNWLYSYRWEQLIANRNRFDLVEALTWNGASTQARTYKLVSRDQR